MCSEKNINSWTHLEFIADPKIEHGIHLGNHFGFCFSKKLSEEKRDITFKQLQMIFTLFFLVSYWKCNGSAASQTKNELDRLGWKLQTRTRLYVGTAVRRGQDCQMGGWPFYFPVNFWCLQHRRIKIIPDQWGHQKYAVAAQPAERNLHELKHRFETAESSKSHHLFSLF